jgi:hypothetical protein
VGDTIFQDDWDYLAILADFTFLRGIFLLQYGCY